MSSSNIVFQALREANPVPVEPIADRPTVQEIFARVERPRHGIAVPGSRPSAIRPLVVAVSVFAAVVLVGLAAFLLSTRHDAVAPTDSEPTVPTSLPTTPTTTMTPPTTIATRSEQVSPATQAVLDQFEQRYSAGDVDGLLALVADGIVKTTKRDADPDNIWDMEDVRYQLEVDAILNTSLGLVDCRELQSGSVSCTARRENDLTRIAGVGAQDDSVTLRVESGEITVWQDRQGVTATPYQLAAVAPFTAWLANAHPEIEDPHPFDGGVSRWWRSRDILSVLPDLLIEYAASVASSAES